MPKVKKEIIVEYSKDEIMLILKRHALTEPGVEYNKDDEISPLVEVHMEVHEDPSDGNYAVLKGATVTIQKCLNLG